MNSKNMLMGIMIGIAMAILWSIVFVNVLNSMAGIGVGVCLGISIPAFIIWLVLFFKEVRFDTHKAFEKYLLK